MNKYIDELLKNNECLCIVNPLKNIISPDRLKYAFLADGSLVVDKNMPTWQQEDLCKELAEIFPDYTINVKTVPPQYIPEIYTWSLMRQKSAKQIYIDLLNEKIEHLREELNLSKEVAQNAILKISGFRSWPDIEAIGEAQARFLINLEKRKRENAQDLGYDYIIYEYKKI